jgi:hypothetical protein
MHRAFVELSKAYILKENLKCHHFLKSRYMQDKKSSKKFQYDGSDIVMLWLLILSIRKTIKTDKKEFSHTIFVELFMAHLLEKSSRFYHRSEPRYMLKIKNVATL